MNCCTQGGAQGVEQWWKRQRAVLERCHLNRRQGRTVEAKVSENPPMARLPCFQCTDLEPSCELAEDRASKFTTMSEVEAGDVTTND